MNIAAVMGGGKSICFTSPFKIIFKMSAIVVNFMKQETKHMRLNVFTIAVFMFIFFNFNIVLTSSPTPTLAEGLFLASD